MSSYKQNGKPTYQCRCGLFGKSAATTRYLQRRTGQIPDVELYSVEQAIERAGI